MGNDSSSYREDVFDQILECVVGIHSNHSENYVPVMMIATRDQEAFLKFLSLGKILVVVVPGSYTEVNVDAAGAVAVYGTFIRSWYHYDEDRTDDREKEIIDMIFKLIDLSSKLRAITLARKVCKPWAEMLKTNLDEVQSSIKLMDADVVMCYAVTMLRRYSLRPEWVLYNDYHPPSKHIRFRGKQPLLLNWNDETPPWMLGLEALKKMGEDAQVRALYKRSPTVFEITVDRNTPDHPYVTAQRCALGEDAQDRAPDKRLPTVFEITVDRNTPDHPYVAASTAQRCALGELGVLNCWGCCRKRKRKRK